MESHTEDRSLIALSHESQDTPEYLLSVYYKPLGSYQNRNRPKAGQQGGLLSFPVWQWRQFELEEQAIIAKMKRLKVNLENSHINEAEFLLALTVLCAKTTHKDDFKFEKLTDEQKITLLNLAEVENPEAKRTPMNAFATSLLVTLLLRDDDSGHRALALRKLLKQSANDEQDVISISLDSQISTSKKWLNNHVLNKDLLKVVYIDFSYTNFTGLSPNGLNLSGQNLRYMLANEMEFNGMSFRFACLEHADLSSAMLARCDFTGANLWKADLSKAQLANCTFNDANLWQADLSAAQIENSTFERINGHELRLEHATAQDICFKQANLYCADLKRGNFTGSFFERSDLTGANFFGAILKRANMPLVKGLDIEMLKDAKTIDDCSLSKRNFSYDEDIKAIETTEFKKDRGKVTWEEDQSSFFEQDNDLTFTPFIQGEKVSYHGPSPLWPKEDTHLWHYDDDWCKGNKEARLCHLEKHDSLYRLLESFVLHSCNASYYQARRFELARLKKAIEQNQALGFIKQEIEQPPTAGGKGSIEIKAIQLNYHPKVWARYQQKKHEIEDKVSHQAPSAITWHNRMKNGLPLINPQTRECWMFHGAPYEVMPLITQNGFNIKFSSKSVLSGYGALGRGIYCSDNFAKAATYVKCPKCAENVCKCPEEERQKYADKKSWKAIFVVRVMLGNVYIDRYKKRTHERSLPSGYHSAWGPYRVQEGDSDFARNEFIVNDDQIYPEFCVFYTDRKSPKKNIAPLSQVKEKFSALYEDSLFHRALHYYRHQEWERTVHTLQLFESDKGYLDEAWGDWLFEILLMKGSAYYHYLNDSLYLVEALNYMMENQPQKIAALFHRYGNEPLALKLLQEGSANFQDALIHYMAEWAWRQVANKNWTIGQWEQEYWLLSDSSVRQHFRDVLLKKIEAEPESPLTWTSFAAHLADEAGQRRKTKETMARFYEANLPSMAQKEKSEVEVYYLQGKDKKKGYLKSTYVEQLFLNEGGLKVSEHDQANRSLVRYLRDATTQEVLVCVTFYPRYPLRQYAVDSLRARLSGWHHQTTLGFLKHEHKKTRFAYPVLFSMPLESTQTEQHLMSSSPQKVLDNKQALNVQAFTWKVIETLLILPQQESNEDFICVPVRYDQERGQKTYALVNQEAGQVFQYKRPHGEAPYNHLAIFLMEEMHQPLNDIVIAEFLHRDWKKLLKEWVKELFSYTNTLNQANGGFFEEKDLIEWERLRTEDLTFESQWFKYNRACDPEALFRSADLCAIYQQIQRISEALEKLKESAKVVTHWDLVQEIEPHLANDLNKAHNSIQPQEDEIKHLERIPSFLAEKFKVETPLLSFTKLGKQHKNLAGFIQQYEDWTTLFDALQNKKSIEPLKEVMRVKDYPIVILEELLSQLRWEEFSEAPEFSEEILKFYAEQISLSRLKLQACPFLTYPHLAQLIKKSQNSLRELIIIDCGALEGNIGEIMKHCTQLKTIYLSDINITGLFSMPSLLKNKGILELSELKQFSIRNCKHLAKVEIIAAKIEHLEVVKTPRLEILKILENPEVNLNNTPLNSTRLSKFVKASPLEKLPVLEKPEINLTEAHLKYLHFSEYGKVEQLREERSMTYLKAGSKQGEQGNHHEALKQYDEAIRWNPKNHKAYYRRGLAQHKAGNYMKAIENYDQALSLNAHHAAYFNSRGFTKAHLARYEEALADYNQAIVLSPHHAAYFNNRGFAKAHLAQYQYRTVLGKNIPLEEALEKKKTLEQEAMADYLKAVELHAAHPDYVANCGFMHIQLGKYEEAVKNYNEAIKLNCNVPTYFHLRGLAKANLGYYKEGLEDYDQAIRLNSQDASYFADRGFVKSTLGWYEGALEDYELAVLLHSDNKSHRNNLGMTKACLGRYQQALEDYQQAFIIKPDDGLTLKNMAFAYLMQNKLSDAQTGFERVLELTAANHYDEHARVRQYALVGLMFIGWLYNDTAVSTIILPNFDEIYHSLKISSQKTYLVCDLLAVFFRKVVKEQWVTQEEKLQGAFEAVTQALSRLIEDCPQEPKVKYYLAELLWWKGEVEKAREHLKSCLAISPHYVSAQSCLEQLTQPAPAYLKALTERSSKGKNTVRRKRLQFPMGKNNRLTKPNTSSLDTLEKKTAEQELKVTSISLGYWREGFFEKRGSKRVSHEDPSAISEMHKLPTSNVQNSAVKFFLGNNPAESLLEFKNWYYPDVCHYLLHMTNNQSQCIRVIFHDASDGNHAKAFENQLQQLMMLSNKLQRPAVFISKEPGADNHFIFGLVKKNQLVLINPLGITTHQNCYQILADLQREYIIHTLWLSSSVLQQRDYEVENLVSCGPIALELSLHILAQLTPEALESFWANELKAQEPTRHNVSGLIYYGMNLNRLLPDTLKGLDKASEVEYQQRIKAIRQSHCHQLKVLPELAVQSGNAVVIEDYVTQCKESAPAQVVFNALITMSHTISTIHQLPEHQLLERELHILLQGSDVSITETDQKMQLDADRTSPTVLGTQVTSEQQVRNYHRFGMLGNRSHPKVNAGTLNHNPEQVNDEAFKRK